MLHTIIGFIGAIVCFFEPNAIDDFARILMWVGRL